MEQLLCLGAVVLPVVIGLFIVISHFKAKRKVAEARNKAEEEARNKAKKVYLDSLEMLKRDPQNSNLREKTLALGRTKLKVEMQGGPLGPLGLFVEVPLMDEVALMNDIHAACT